MIQQTFLNSHCEYYADEHQVFVRITPDLSKVNKRYDVILTSTFIPSSLAVYLMPEQNANLKRKLEYYFSKQCAA